ncbi:dihydrodipicolinate synthase family protein [Conexibacter sp. CPCC 206217]|uniref:dihydrodipicolinate synthase family protein n=1 Tax=Conexibacter sp. CPCC 206217 TaxID=3064574 RepID=UPI00271ACB83|nr:dihydrodipicolinate synthase family protein [Conexibacter sp. CPCC 206217]MDO8210238.1 dihydrodipicolinate synthase family protein [Conexibacter sp. CPCC 206217]
MTTTDQAPAARELPQLLSGVVAVLPTPFERTGGEVDLEALERLTAVLDSAGVHTLTALGNTGEVFQLNAEERRAVLAATARGRTRAGLIAGVTGALSEALESASEAERLGYDAVMLHDPPDPLAGERGIVGLITEFADRSPLPVVLYVRTPRLGADALAELALHPQIVGVKYARHDLHVLGTLLERPGVRDACTWTCGLAESMVAPMRALGLVGFTSGIANVRPDLSLAVWRASRAGDFDALAAALRPLLPFELLRTRAGGRHNVAVVKAALALTGADAGEVRAPCEPLDARAAEALAGIVRAWPASV